jgi:hypothetical protein
MCPAGRSRRVHPACVRPPHSSIMYCRCATNKSNTITYLAGSGSGSGASQKLDAPLYQCARRSGTPELISQRKMQL